MSAPEHLEHLCVIIGPRVNREELVAAAATAVSAVLDGTAFVVSTDTEAEALARAATDAILAEGATPIEHCRQDVGQSRCGKVADLILWGKLFPLEALGPRCLKHAFWYMSTDEHTIAQAAVFDLRTITRIGDVA